MGHKPHRTKTHRTIHPWDNSPLGFLATGQNPHCYYRTIFYKVVLFDELILAILIWILRNISFFSLSANPNKFIMLNIPLFPLSKNGTV